jgi:hypothetical protein
VVYYSQGFFNEESIIEEIDATLQALDRIAKTAAPKCWILASDRETIRFTIEG